MRRRSRGAGLVRRRRCHRRPPPGTRAFERAPAPTAQSPALPPQARACVRLQLSYRFFKARKTVHFFTGFDACHRVRACARGAAPDEAACAPSGPSARPRGVAGAAGCGPGSPKPQRARAAAPVKKSGGGLVRAVSRWVKGSKAAWRARQRRAAGGGLRSRGRPSRALSRRRGARAIAPRFAGRRPICGQVMARAMRSCHGERNAHVHN